jgi:hypothetical protein
VHETFCNENNKEERQREAVDRQIQAKPTRGSDDDLRSHFDIVNRHGWFQRAIKERRVAT